MAILNETPELSNEIHNIARLCAIRLQQTYKFNQQFFKDRAPVVFMEEIDAPNGLHEIIKHNTITYDFYDHGHYATALPNGDIEINANMVNINDTSLIISAITHELRHTIDDAISDGSAFKDYPKHNPKLDPESAEYKKEYKEYIRHNTEVSARIEQALLYIQSYCMRFLTVKGINNQELVRVINEAAQKNQLTIEVVGNKINKAYMRRASQFASYIFSKFIEDIKKNRRVR